MPVPKDKSKWDSQYKSDFRPRRYPRQVAKRPTSASRRNNPHPEKDFLLYERQATTKEEEVHDILHSAISRSAKIGQGGPRDLNSIPLGPVPKFEPESEVSPHWSQWPQPPASARPQRSVQIDLSPRPCYSARIARQSPNTPGLHTEPGELYSDSYDMNHGDRDIIMSRGLSPRRAAPSRIPGRTMTHYGSFGNRENPNPYIGVLDLHASPYNANRGFNQGITAYTSRQNRPMHRHLKRATKGEEYLHNHSIFYSTTPMATGYFIIHPDWVSERVSLRRSKSLLSF